MPTEGIKHRFTFTPNALLSHFDVQSFWQEKAVWRSCNLSIKLVNSEKSYADWTNRLILEKQTVKKKTKLSVSRLRTKSLWWDNSKWPLPSNYLLLLDSDKSSAVVWDDTILWCETITPPICGENLFYFVWSCGDTRFYILFWICLLPNFESMDIFELGFHITPNFPILYFHRYWGQFS